METETELCCTAKCCHFGWCNKRWLDFYPGYLVISQLAMHVVPKTKALVIIMQTLLKPDKTRRDDTVKVQFYIRSSGNT